MPGQKNVSRDSVSMASVASSDQLRSGLILLGILIVGMGMINAKAINNLASAKNCSLPAVNAVSASPVPSAGSAAMVSPSATPKPATLTPPLVQPTNPESITVMVKKIDNFWKIAERTCGHGKYAEAIKRQTGYTYRALQPGDILQVQCP